MDGLFTSRRGAIVYLLFWLFLGAALGGVVALSGAARLPNALLFAVPVCLVYAFMSGYSAYYLCRAYPLGSPKAGSIPLVFSVAAVLSGFAWMVVAMAWNGLCELAGLAWLGVALSAQLQVLMVGLGVLLYGFAAAVHYVVIEFVRAKSAEQRELESKLMAQDAELRMLRTQIDPHFLFNSLNSISALTSQNPKAARAMTLELASFFRQSLGLEAHKKIALGEEMALIRHFLSVEQVRFGERLGVEEQLDSEALPCLVPPMIIQPLVENAVKHGIGGLTEGGTVRIKAQRNGSLLHIRVENEYDADEPPKKGNGIGLANVRQRLACAYKHEASIHWARQGAVYAVDITLPVELG